MRFIGRLAAPILFFFIAEGYHHTGDKNKYMGRLAIFALLSYVPFVWFLSGTLPNGNNWLDLNVIYTLFLGFLALRARREIHSLLLKSLAIAALFALSWPGDWSYYALFYILAFDHFRGDFLKQAYAYLAITFITALPEFIYLFSLLFGSRAGGAGYLAVVIINLGRFLPIGLLYFYNGRKGRGGKWAQWGFYAFYPLHVLLLCVLRALLNG
jgi:hypothetical protein